MVQLVLQLKVLAQQLAQDQTSFKKMGVLFRVVV